VGLLWWNAHRFGYRTPFFAMTLLALSPTIIRWGDGVRAYGIGMCCMLLTFGLLWEVATAPSKTKFLLATIAAIFSVHTFYQNALLLFAICTSAAILTVCHKRWKQSVLILGIGFIAAVTMLIYYGPMHHEADWYVLVLDPSVQFSFLLMKLVEALSAAGSLIPWLWAVLYLGAIVIAVLCIRNSSADSRQRDLAIYALSALLIATLVYAIFLKHLRYITYPWHYVPLMALIASAIDAILSIPGNSGTARMIRLGVLSVVLVFTFGHSWDVLQVRSTNLDSAAKSLNQSAGTNDFVLVAPWYVGMTFQRYYAGKAPWETLPPIHDHRVAHYDELKTLISNPRPVSVIDPIFAKITTTLKAGGKVWLVGGIRFLPQNQKPLTLPPAPNTPYGWRDWPYYEMWSQQVGYYLQTHALHAAEVKLPDEGRVSEYENCPLLVVDGWRGP
jgi:hypothetical protein